MRILVSTSVLRHALKLKYALPVAQMVLAVWLIHLAELWTVLTRVWTCPVGLRF